MITRSLLACQSIHSKGDERNTYAVDEWGFGILLPDCVLRIFCRASDSESESDCNADL